MKIAGFLLLLAGWGLTLTALGLLRGGGARGAFVASGFAVELIGLGLAVHSHRAPSRKSAGRDRL